MKSVGIIVILVILVLFSGCTSYFDNLQTPQRTLNLTESAIFSQEKTNFIATVTSVNPDKTTSPPRNILVSMTVKNTGKDAFSLIGYPRLVDGDGKEYPGSTIMFGGINPGGIGSGKSTIPLKTDEDFLSLQKSATLNVRFQSMKPLPYEGIWNIDFTTL